jgi:hypothetical protein
VGIVCGPIGSLQEGYSEEAGCGVRKKRGRERPFLGSPEGVVFLLGVHCRVTDFVLGCDTLCRCLPTFRMNISTFSALKSEHVAAKRISSQPRRLVNSNPRADLVLSPLRYDRGFLSSP